MIGSFDCVARANSFLAKGNFLLGRTIGILLLLLAFAGSIGFDDRLHYRRAPKAFLLPLPSKKTIGALGAVGIIAFLFSANQSGSLYLGMAMPASAFIKETSKDIWRQRNQKNQAEKRTIKRQNSRLKEKVMCLKNEQNKAETLAEAERRRAAEKEAINRALDEKLDASNSKLAVITEQHRSLVEELETVKNERDSWLDLMNHEVDKAYTRRERSPYPVQFVAKIVKVALVGVCLRTLVKTLKELSKLGLFEHRIPCATSVGNWVCRAGLGELKRSKEQKEPYVMIVDHCVAIGGIKLFVALAISKSAYAAAAKGERAINLNDLTFLDMIPMRTSTAVVMCATYKRLFAQAGRRPEFILSDKGSDLIAGLRLYRKVSGNRVEHVHDFSHMAANLLKAKYSKESWLKEFRKLSHSGSAKLRLGENANWAIPSDRDNLRFFNIKPRLLGAKKILDFTRNKGRPKHDSIEQVLHRAYPDLRRYEGNINECINDVELSEKIAEMLKNKGYSPETHQQCSKLLADFDQTDPYIQGLCSWLNQCKMLHVRLQKAPLEDRWDLPLPISSDSIESLFSRYKSLLSRMPTPEPTRCILILPLLVGKQDTTRLTESLKDTTMDNVNQWVGENLPKSRNKQRREISQESKVLAAKTGDKIPTENQMEKAC